MNASFLLRSGRFQKQTNEQSVWTASQSGGMCGVWSNRSLCVCLRVCVCVCMCVSASVRPPAASSSQTPALRREPRERWGEAVSESFPATRRRCEFFCSHMIQFLSGIIIYVYTFRLSSTSETLKLFGQSFTKYHIHVFVFYLICSSLNAVKKWYD